MLLRTKLHGKTYEFPDIRLLMGKANEEKSGDHSRVLARRRPPSGLPRNWCWPKCRSGCCARIPPCPTTRTKSRASFRMPSTNHLQRDQRLDGGGVPRMDSGRYHLADMIRRISHGLTAEMISGVTKLMSNLDLMYARQEDARHGALQQHHRRAGHAFQPHAAQPSHRLARRHPRRNLRRPVLRLRRLGHRHQPGRRLVWLRRAPARYDLRCHQDLEHPHPKLRAGARHHPDEVHGIRFAGRAGLPVPCRFAERQRLLWHLGRHAGRSLCPGQKALFPQRSQLHVF